MSDNKEFIKVKSGKHPSIVKAQFKSVEFENDGHQIIYIPSLGISAYGSNLEEANEMMKIVLKDAMEAFDKCTPAELFAELKTLGWQRNSLFKTELSKSAHVDKEGILREFDLAENTELQERLVTV